VILPRWLTHPLTRGLDLDDPRTTELRRHIIQENDFLRQLYEEWYADIAVALPKNGRPVLELGSGAGFLSDFVPGLITSDVFRCRGLDLVLNGLKLPFVDGALGGIAMTDVLHHVPQPRQFFMEAARCVGSGGVVVMNEPWVTPWSRLIWGHLHHEPFEPLARTWEFPSSGPLSGANSALPWIIFERDRRQFERDFPCWRIHKINLGMPFRYLMSGGVSGRSFMPGWTFGVWRRLENCLQPWMSTCAMFAMIVLAKVDGKIPDR
jgi:hypothetical protein